MHDLSGYRLTCVGHVPHGEGGGAQVFVTHQQYEHRPGPQGTMGPGGRGIKGSRSPGVHGIQGSQGPEGFGDQETT